ncbi:Os01g0121500, partial [Oryza sativa Japonica Group]
IKSQHSLAAQFFLSESKNATGGVVDEGMIELRRRIHEMRAAESGWEPPAEWAAWEKEWYGSYDADVCALVGAVQAFLMSSRPGVGVGIVAAVAVSVPTTAFVLVSGLLHASQSLLSNLQH